jgi:hypothetical protein
MRKSKGKLPRPGLLLLKKIHEKREKRPLSERVFGVAKSDFLRVVDNPMLLSYDSGHIMGSMGRLYGEAF